MRKIRIAVVGVMLVCLLGFLPDANALQPSADGPTTYTVKYVESAGEWKYQPIYPFDDSLGSGPLHVMQQELKDGDTLVISGSEKNLELKLTQHLSNLTLEGGTTAVVTTGGVDECYVLQDSVAAINGDVKNAYIYDNAACTFNNNVEYMEIVSSKDWMLKATVTVGGTVGHLKGYDLSGGTSRLHYEHYQFTAGSLKIENGDVKTVPGQYSSQPPAPVVSPQPEALTPDAAQSAMAPQNLAADAYDDVPKTGDTTSYAWLLGIAACCLTGGMLLGYSSRRKYSGR